MHGRAALLLVLRISAGVLPTGTLMLRMGRRLHSAGISLRGPCCQRSSTSPAATAATATEPSAALAKFSALVITLGPSIRAGVVCSIAGRTRVRSRAVAAIVPGALRTLLPGTCCTKKFALVGMVATRIT